MMVIRSSQRMRAVARRFHRSGGLGVVMTMGAFHEGHLALIRSSVAQNDRTIVTVFVNPLQFGPREDYHRYPRSLREDMRAARAAGADVLFVPDGRQMYPDGFQTTVEVGPLARRWEGRARPGQ